MMTEHAIAPSSSAERARRYRHRRRHSTVVVPVEVMRNEIEALVEFGLLDEPEVTSRAKISDAVETLLTGLAFDLLRYTAEHSAASRVAVALHKGLRRQRTNARLTD